LPPEVVSSLVTGAAGFLGSHLTDALLSANHEVIGIDNLSTGRITNLKTGLENQRFRFVRGDLMTLRRLPRVNYYFHLASPASPFAFQENPIGTLRVNAEGSHRVLEAARRSDGRVLIASTAEVYGDPDVHPQRETYWGRVNPIGFRSCYEEGKRYSEALATAYRRTYGLDVRIARIFNTYGPRMEPGDGRVVSNFIVQGLRAEPFTIAGRGQQTRSFCYVTDMIDAIVRLMAASPRVPTPMNLGNPTEVTIQELARIVALILGVPLKTRRIPAAQDDPRQRCPDVSNAKRYLGWTARVTLEDGVQETADFLRRRLAE